MISRSKNSKLIRKIEKVLELELKTYSQRRISKVNSNKVLKRDLMRSDSQSTRKIFLKNNQRISSLQTETFEKQPLEEWNELQQPIDLKLKVTENQSTAKIRSHPNKKDT